MFGFLLIHKPKDFNSFGLVKILRKILNIKRIGYAGTLDPLATGLMIVAVGEATKLLSYLEKMDKVYEVEITFGVTSATYDSEGPLTISEFQGKIHRFDIEKVIKDQFLGEREQKPPLYSAIQIDGKRAYSFARKGLSVDLKSRRVIFHEIQLKHFFWPKLEVVIHCSSGTYIRSFAHDLGQVLGCGAYVSQLRRTKIGNFSVKDAVPLNDLNAENINNFLLSPQQFLTAWPCLNLHEQEYFKLSQGGFIQNIQHFRTRPILALYKDQCVGMLEPVKDFQSLKFLKKFVINCFSN